MASFMGSSLSTDYMTLVFQSLDLFSHQESGERIGQCDSTAVLNASLLHRKPLSSFGTQRDFISEVCIL